VGARVLVSRQQRRRRRVTHLEGTAWFLCLWAPGVWWRGSSSDDSTILFLLVTIIPSSLILIITSLRYGGNSLQ